MVAGFQFDKLFIIESLLEGEDQTGRELYDKLNPIISKTEGLSSDYKNVNSLSEFKAHLDLINHEVKINGTYPIIHFEIHGSPDGLILSSNELMTWSELYEYLVTINTRINNNLFVTLAVCRGAYLLKEIKPMRPCPLWGFVGSFDELFSSDILMRYTDFYISFLSTFNLDEAVQTLLTTSTHPRAGNYRFINSEMMFKRVYNLYFATQYDPLVLRKRFEDALKDERLTVKDPNMKNQLFNKFKDELLSSKKKFFEQHRDRFFMIDIYPENVEQYLTDYLPPFE
jgi:hypothetical protein